MLALALYQAHNNSNRDELEGPNTNTIPDVRCYRYDQRRLHTAHQTPVKYSRMFEGLERTRFPG